MKVFFCFLLNELTEQWTVFCPPGNLARGLYQGPDPASVEEELYLWCESSEGFLSLSHTPSLSLTPFSLSVSLLLSLLSVCLSLSLSPFSLSVCLSPSLPSLCLSVSLPLSLLSVCLSLSLSPFSLSVCLSPSLPSLCLSVCLPLSLLSVCLSLSLLSYSLSVCACFIIIPFVMDQVAFYNKTFWFLSSLSLSLSLSLPLLLSLALSPSASACTHTEEEGKERKLTVWINFIVTELCRADDVQFSIALHAHNALSDVNKLCFTCVCVRVRACMRVCVCYSHLCKKWWKLTWNWWGGTQLHKESIVPTTPSGYSARYVGVFWE